MILLLQTIDETKNSTVSKLLVEKDFLCFILEDGFNEPKIKHHSRIPEGEYLLKKRTWGRFYEKYKKRFGHDCTFEITGIPNFSQVLFHIGNFINDTSGCLLTGNKIARNRNTYQVYNSTKAYKQLYKRLRPRIDSEEIILKVMR